MGKWLRRFLIIAIVLLYWIAPDLLPGPFDDLLVSFFGWLIDHRAEASTRKEKALQWVERVQTEGISSWLAQELGDALFRQEDIERRVEGLETERRRIWPIVLVCFFIFATYYPLGQKPIEIRGEKVEIPTVQQFRNEVGGEMVTRLDPSVETWTKRQGIQLQLFEEVVSRCNIPRNAETGRPLTEEEKLAGAQGVTIDPWTVYAIFTGENYKGWEHSKPDPRKKSTAGKNLAYNAIGSRFNALWERGEKNRQHEALKKIVEQPGLREKYPGLTINNIHGSIAGALGVPQGMPHQSYALMSDWVENGIYDPWQDEASIAEFTIRYLVRAYTKGGREKAWWSYNPNGPSSYFQTLRATANKLEASWNAEFGREQPSTDMVAVEARKVVSAHVVSPRQDMVTYQIGWGSDTLLLRTLRWSKGVEETTGEALCFLESMEKIAPFIGSENLHKVLIWLAKGLHYPAKWLHAGSLFIAKIAYGDQDVVSSEIRQARREKEPVGEDVVSEMNLWTRNSPEIADNIRWILVQDTGNYQSTSDPGLREAELTGYFVVPATEQWDYTKELGNFTSGEGYRTVSGIPGSGACDLATQIYSLALRTPGLTAWRGEQHATPISGFSHKEAVNIWIGRKSANLILTNNLGQDIVIYWRLSPSKVIMWTSREVQRERTVEKTGGGKGQAIAQAAEGLIGKFPYGDNTKGPGEGYYVCTDIVAAVCAKAGVPLVPDYKVWHPLRWVETQIKYFQGQSIEGTLDQARAWHNLGEFPQPGWAMFYGNGRSHIAVVIGAERTENNVANVITVQALGGHRGQRWDATRNIDYQTDIFRLQNGAWMPDDPQIIGFGEILEK